MKYCSLFLAAASVILVGVMCAGCQSVSREGPRAIAVGELPSDPTNFELRSRDVFSSPDQARRARHAMIQSREIESSAQVMLLMTSFSDTFEGNPHRSRELSNDFHSLISDLISFRLRYKLEVVAQYHRRNAYLDPNVFEEELEVLRARRDVLWERLIEENESIIREPYHSIYPIESFDTEDDS